MQIPRLRSWHYLILGSYIVAGVGTLMVLDSVLSGLTRTRRDVSQNQPEVTQVQSGKSNEGFGEITTSNGEVWGLVKLWGYSDHPSTVPNTDLATINQALAKNYRVVLLQSHEAEGVKPVLGWRLELGSTEPMRNTPEFTARYPEIFQVHTGTQQ